MASRIATVRPSGAESARAPAHPRRGPTLVLGLLLALAAPKTAASQELQLEGFANRPLPPGASVGVPTGPADHVIPTWKGVGSIPMPSRPGGLQADLDRLWRERAAALEAGDEGRAAAILDRVYEAALGHGQRDLPLHAAALLREARRRMDEGDIDGVDARIQAARRLAPSHPQTAFANAELLARLGPSKWIQAISEIGAGFRIASQELRARIRLAASLHLTFFVTLVTLAVLVPGCVVLRHARRIGHWLGHLRPSWLYPRVGVVLLGALPVLAALAGLGVLWLAAALTLVALLAGDTVREKAVVGVVALFIAVAPLWVGRMATPFVHLDRVVDDPVVRAQSEAYSVDLARALVEEAGEEGESTAIVASLALIAKRGGHLTFAEAALRHLLEQDPGAAWVHNNLGNVLYNAGYEEIGLKAHRKARDLDPGLLEAHFNESQVLLKNFVLMAGREAFGRAQAIDDARVHEFNVTAERVRNRFLMDVPVPAPLVLARLVPDPAEVEATADALWASVFHGLPRTLFPVAWLVLLAGASFLAWQSWNGAFLMPACSRCGVPLCRTCGVYAGEGFECESCLSLAVGNSILDPVFKKDRLDTIRAEGRRLRLWGRVLSILLPGAGHVFLGAPILGGLLMLGAALLLVQVFFWNGLVPPAVVPWANPAGLVFVLLLTVVAGVWALANVHVWRAAARQRG